MSSTHLEIHENVYGNQKRLSHCDALSILYRAEAQEPASPFTQSELELLSSKSLKNKSQIWSFVLQNIPTNKQIHEITAR